MKYLICYIENITKHVFQKLLKAVTMAVLLSLLAAVLLPVGTVLAEESASFSWYNPETGYDILIEDDAALLTTEEKNLLADTMERVSYYGNVAFKSIDYNPQSTSSYARSYFHETFGSGVVNGTLFLIDMDNRELYIFSDGDVYRTVTTSYANVITDNIYTYASDGDYFTCADSAFDQIASLLEGQKIAMPMKYISNALLALLLSAMLNYFLVSFLSRSRKCSDEELLSAGQASFVFRNAAAKKTTTTKVYNPSSSGSGGGSSGGGGGGGSSGGGGGHSF